MQIAQTLRTRQTLAASSRMQAALRLLAMPLPELYAHLADRAQVNPCLELHLPEPPSRLRRAAAGAGDAAAALAAADESLQAGLARQIERRFADAAERRIAYAYLEAMAPTGWIETGPAEVAARLRCPEPMAVAVLAACQGFEPAGVFARALPECLALQAREAGCLDAPMRVLLADLDAVAAGRLEALADAAGLPLAALATALRRLRAFSPKPGLGLPDAAGPLPPADLTVACEDGRWVARINPAVQPVVGLAALPRHDPRDTAAARWIAEAQGEVRWLGRVLRRRAATQLRVAEAVLARQGDWLAGTGGGLAPLTLADIAGDLGLHASTVSRAVSGCRIAGPEGNVALRALFSRRVGGDGAAAGASRAAALGLVAGIVAGERPGAALSDAAIAAETARRGVRLSRRTVAKYRGLLGIAPAHRRRRDAAPA